MFVLGLVLLILGLVAALKILFWIGLVFLLVGLVLEFAPNAGGTRRRYY